MKKAKNILITSGARFIKLHLFVKLVEDNKIIIVNNLST